MKTGAIINIDDISLFRHLKAMPSMPNIVCFRYNPGKGRGEDKIFGDPREQKYGVPHEFIVDAYKLAKDNGVSRFGIHTMLNSNSLDNTYFSETVRMLFKVALELKSKLGIQLEFINMGGGLGIPYKPDDKPLDIFHIARQIRNTYEQFKVNLTPWPRLYMESGRYMTGPHGVLVTRVINPMQKYKKFIGVDSCMSALPRPAVYRATGGGYHDILVHDKDGNNPKETVNVSGALCENWDQFAIDRELPILEEDDILLIQDTGAHSHASGSPYNDRYRIQELLLKPDSSVIRIRREETIADELATMDCDPSPLTFG